MFYVYIAKMITDSPHIAILIHARGTIYNVPLQQRIHDGYCYDECHSCAARTASRKLSRDRDSATVKPPDVSAVCVRERKREKACMNTL